MPIESTPIKSKENKKDINELWDKPYKGLSLEGRSLTLKEYFREMSLYYKTVFENTEKVYKLQNIPEDKYILFIDATGGAGVVYDPAIKNIDHNIVDDLYISETGHRENNEKFNFQADNMRYCLGIKEDDKRFRVVKTSNHFKEQIPNDINENCVGVISSGSGADVKGDEDIDHIIMKIKLSEFLKKLPEDTPKFGICFSAQLMANVYSGVEIDFIYGKENGEPERRVGVHEVFRTIDHEFLSDFEDKFYAGKNHGQEIKAKSILPEDGEILAVNEEGGVEILNLKKVNAIVTQFHPEAGFVRLMLSYILEDKEAPEEILKHVFSREYDSMREAFFPAVLQTIGEHLKQKK